MQMADFNVHLEEYGFVQFDGMAIDQTWHNT